ncbi:MAG: TetR/AcrR family transcriptional regulator [Candidatus Thermoplasmatota archaeon]
MRKDPDDRKIELIDAAESLFSEKGFSETSVNDICDKVGVAHGLFYYYFDSKEDLIEAITAEVIGELESKLEAILEDLEMRADEKFIRFLSLSFQRENKRPYLASYFSKIDSPQVYYSLFDELVDILTPYLTEIVEQGREEGIFHTKYPEQTIRFWLNGRLFMVDKDDLFREEVFEDMMAQAFMLERLLGSERSFLTSFYEEKEEEIKTFLQKASEEEID